MKRKWLLSTGAIVLAGAGFAGITSISGPPHGDAKAAVDPRVAPPLVRIAVVAPAEGVRRSFTGTVAARVESDLGFRVPGKIVERLVDVGDQVVAGQPLMRLDDTDLQLALAAKRNAVLAARAVLVQAVSQEKRMALLQQNGAIVSLQRYEQAKAALDTAEAQLAAAEAEANVAGNATGYAVLIADAAGTITGSMADAGQVVAAGQPVLRLAQDGEREAVIYLPETLRPAAGSVAEARIYGSSQPASPAHLRLLSDSANPQSRTFEARYVLEGEAASAPFGSTVTIVITDAARAAEVAVPLGAILDNGTQSGVWAIDRSTATVRFVPVDIRAMGAETAAVIGVPPGAEVVALGAHLLKDGAAIRFETSVGGAN